MATPAGTVQATPISRAVNVRSQVARVARSSVPQVGKGTWTSSRNMDTSPRRTSAPSRPASTHPAIRRGDGKREDCSGDNACASPLPSPLSGKVRKRDDDSVDNTYVAEPGG